MKRAALVLFLAVICFSGMRPQNPSLTPFENTVTSGQGTHTQCNVSPTGGSSLCQASDGLWLSINGAAFTQVCTVGLAACASTATGVTSFNGRTGAVVSATGDYSFSQISGTATASQVPAAPVSSVNGQTGAVTITLTSQ
jgi:hypothetical protein